MTLPVDDAIYENESLQPTAKPLHWLPFGFMAALLFFIFLLWWRTFTAIFSDLQVMSILSGLFTWLIMTLVLSLLVYSLYAQWRALRKPALVINRAKALVELSRPYAVRRIPTSLIREIRVAANPARNPLERLETKLLERLGLTRYGVGLVLKHGEIVWCAVITGDEAEARATTLRDLLNYSSKNE